jgi:outer membrane protein OmpA-like peptidoglycan-associated protein
MRSRLLVLLLVAACGANQHRRCTPVPSFSAPAGECVALAEAPKPEPPKPPPPKVKEPEPEPPPPEPEPPPPEPPPTVVVTKEKIELDRTVQFESGKAVLIEDSEKLLDDVVKVLKDHPEIALIQIEGHTDAVGKDRANKKLSEKRAAAVKTYLIKAGIAKKRLTAKGFGEDKPIADNGTEEGRFKNRRVDLKILKRDDSAASEDKPSAPDDAKKEQDDDKADEDAAETKPPPKKHKKPKKPKKK